VSARPNDVARLEACLDELRYRESAAKWAREALDILERFDPARAETDLKAAPKYSEADRDEMMARCHVMLGKESFFAAERSFWKRASPEAAPDTSCAIQSESRYFEPADQAMSAAKPPRGRVQATKTRRAPAKGGAGANYAPAVHHFERANALFPDPWHKHSPRNTHLATELSCDPCLPSFYLGVIALRQGDLSKARAQLAQVRQVEKKLPIGSARMGRHQVRVAAAVLEAAAAILEGDLAEAGKAMRRARALDPQNIHVLKNLGYLCEVQGKPDEAVSWYQEALRWNKTDGYTRRRLAAAKAQARRAK